MDHHGGVHTREGAALEHQDLAPSALFSRRPEYPHTETEVVSDRGQCESGAHGGRRDDVVPARVAHCGQRVVLRADRHHELSCARARLECRGEVVDPLVDFEPACPHGVGHGAG